MNLYSFACGHPVFSVALLKRLSYGWQDGSAGKSSSCKAWWPELDSLGIHIPSWWKRGSPCTGCPLTFTHVHRCLYRTSGSCCGCLALFTGCLLVYMPVFVSEPHCFCYYCSVRSFEMRKYDTSCIALSARILSFHKHFGVVFSFLWGLSLRNWWRLYWICKSLFGNTAFKKKSILPIHGHWHSLHIVLSSVFFLWCSKILSVEVSVRPIFKLWWQCCFPDFSLCVLIIGM